MPFYTPSNFSIKQIDFLCIKNVISCCKVEYDIILLNNQFYFLGMFRGINKVIEEHVETLPRKELEKIIWANARLNNRTGKLISRDHYCAVLYCSIVLYCIVLYFIVLHCIVLRCTATHCISHLNPLLIFHHN